jgi:2-dehydropantoate 2-reductase
MHVAVVGMGALGRVYGVRLALRAGVRVTFVLRPGRGPEPLRLTRIDGDGAQEEVRAPDVDRLVPADAEAILVCVRAEQLDDSLERLLAATRVPILMLTPVLPHDLDRLTRAHGTRLRIAMPGVVAYVTADGSCRYWLPSVAPTLIDAAPPIEDVVQRLSQALEVAGFGGRLEAGVRETNPATTISFIPLAMGVDAAGGIVALLKDRALLRVTLDAVAEGLALAARIGRTPSWVALMARFAGPTSLKVGMAIARRRAPEALTYVEEHFGRKLHAQNVTMARAIVALADEERTGAKALRQLFARLEGAA